MTIIDEFRSAMASAGIIYSGELIADGKFRKFDADGCHNKAEWYVLHSDGLPAGSFGSYRGVEEVKWHTKNGNGHKMDAREQQEAQRRWREANARKEADKLETQEQVAQRAAKEIASLPLATDHLYLKQKGIQPHGARVMEDSEGSKLALPLQDADGKIWSRQKIDAFGGKKFMSGGRVQGCFYPIGMAQDTPLVICEGFATGASIHEATGWTVWCAMDCGNLKRVCEAARKKFKDRVIVVGCDDDKSEGNPGLTKGTEAAKSVKGVVAVPRFKHPGEGTDFNDLAQAAGIETVKLQFEAVVSVGLGDRVSITDLIRFVPGEDPDCVLGDRFLCRGGSCLIVGPTHVGKSSFAMQMAITLALGGEFFGICANPRRPLKSLIIQAENDLGDTAEMLQGILVGSGLIRGGPENKENDAAILKTLSENLIIVRDQTHVGLDFPPFADALASIHRPDFLWVDPALSFYGDDVNNQQAMSKFLRQGLNPISQRTGLCWMLLHHTGKPMKDQGKVTKSWLSSDFAYMGLGSSEMSNWARAIISILKAGEDEFRVVLAKRGWRAEATDDDGEKVSELYLAHAGDKIHWKQIPKPKEEKEYDGKCVEFARSLGKEFEPQKAADIVVLAAKFLQRGSRTVWRYWDKGSGPLGRCFHREPDGTYSVSI